jgi:hypothetical protein
VLDGTAVAGASVLDGTGVLDGTAVGGTEVLVGMTACEPKAGTTPSGIGEPVAVRDGVSAFAAAFGAGVAHNWGVALAPATDAVVAAPEPPVAGILRAPMDGASPPGPGTARHGSGAAAAALAGADCASTDRYWSGRGVPVGSTVERVSLAWEL